MSANKLNREYISANPAYYVVDKENKDAETIVIPAIRFIDQEGNSKITPSVENSINRTIDATKREGIFILNIDKNFDLSNLKLRIKKAFQIKDAFILITCDTDIIMESVMQELQRNFQLYLVRDPN